MTDGNISRRHFVKGSAVAAGVGLAGCLGDGADADADDYSDFPRRDVTVLHHGSVGGGNETYTRMWARYLPEYMPGDGEFVVTRVRAGGGRVSAEEFYNADPDGYTVGFLNEDIIPVSLIEDVDFEPAGMNFFGNYSVDINSIWVGEHRDDIYQADEPIRVFADLVDDRQLTNIVGSRTGAMLPLVMGELTGWFSADDVFENMVNYDSHEDGVRLIGEGDIDYIPGSWASQAIFSTVEGGPLEALLIGTTDEEPPDDERIQDTAETLGSADVPDGQSVMDLTIDGRTLAGPPGMDDELVEMYRDASESIANDSDYLADMEEAGRPVEFVDGETMQQSVENRIETWQEFPDLLEELFG